MTSPAVTIDGERLSIAFDRFDLDAYDLFIKTKALPETDVTFDWRADTYTLTAPARFASRLGVTNAPQQYIRLLRELQAVWGGSLTETKTPSGCYRWRIAGQKAEAFLRAIRPYVLVKHAVIEEALREREQARAWRRGGK